MACFFVATQNSTNAYWTVDLDYASDLEHRGCLSGAQRGYNVAWGLARENRTAAEKYAYDTYLVHVRQGREDADAVYAQAMSIASSNYHNAVTSAESIAEGEVGSCDRDAAFREIARERERRAEEARERQRQQQQQQQQQQGNNNQNSNGGSGDETGGGQSQATGGPATQAHAAAAINAAVNNNKPTRPH